MGLALPVAAAPVLLAQADTTPAPAARRYSIPPVGPMRDARERKDQVERDYQAGRRSFDAGDNFTAIDYFLRAKQIDPTYHPAAYWLGRAYLAAGAAPSAIDQFSDAITQSPKFDGYYFARARAKVKIGQYASAIDDFNKALEFHGGPQDDLFYSARGDAYLNNGQNDLAVKDFDEALRQKGSIRSVYLHRGVAYARTKDYGRAIADFNTAEALGRSSNSLDFDTYYYRALAEDLSGDKAAASRDYNAADGFNDTRKREARCLASFVDYSKLKFLGRTIGGCGGVDPVKELNKPPA